MTTVEFVHSLTALAPTLQELGESIPGLSVDDYELWRDEFIPKVLVEPHQLNRHTETALDELLSQYDLSGVLILGGIQFYAEPTWEPHYQLVTVAVGEMGHFTVAPTGEIFVHDNFGSFRCARTAEDFYAVLLVFSEYYRKRLLGIVAKEDHEARQACAQQAATVASALQSELDYLHILNAS